MPLPESRRVGQVRVLRTGVVVVGLRVHAEPARDGGLVRDEPPAHELRRIRKHLADSNRREQRETVVVRQGLSDSRVEIRGGEMDFEACERTPFDTALDAVDPRTRHVAKTGYQRLRSD